jgi:Tfp pilus assembly protein PilW
MSELLVAMSLFTVLLVIVGGTFVSITRATTFAAARDQNTRSAQNGMNELSRKLRGAADNPVANAADSPAFTAASPDALTVSTLVATGRDAVPQLASFSVTGGTLVESTTAGRAVGTYFVFDGARSSVRLVDGVDATPSNSSPLFTYFDASGAELVPPTAAGLTGDQRSRISSVTVTLAVANSRSSLQNGIVLQSSVGLPNLLDTTQGNTP